MKDYFYFTKTERNGILVLLVIMLGILLYPSFTQYFREQKVYDFSAFASQISQYHELKEEYLAAQIELAEQQSIDSKNPPPVVLSPFLFDPNTLNPEGFNKMGLPQRVGRNIENYRRAGGSFNSKEDLKRIFSITEEWYYQLEDYIDLPSREQFQAQREERQKEQEEQKKNETAHISFTELVIDINEADTLEWQKIRGIGPVFSNRITAYRERLGGFHSEYQLMEVFGMDSSRFDMIKDHIQLGEEHNLRQIDVNTADFVALVRHPYLNRNQVNSIIQVRERHGLYKNVEDVKQSHLISDSLFTKIAPYLKVISQVE